MTMKKLDISEAESIRKDRGPYLAALVCSVIIALGLAIGLGVGLSTMYKNKEANAAYLAKMNDKSTPAMTTATTEKRTTTRQKETRLKSKVGSYRFAAVAADAEVCSKIGTDIMGRKGGSAVDAAIAAMLCIGVYNFHSAGIGGGSFALVYDAYKEKMDAFDFREIAPQTAHKDMYSKNRALSKTGGLSIAVPGEIAGYKAMHGIYGKLPWRDLFPPAILMCEKGFELGPPLHTASSKSLKYIQENKELRSILIKNNTNSLKPVGSIINLPKLAKTLKKIQEDADAFYQGSLASEIVADLRDIGSTINLIDLKFYNVIQKSPLMTELHGNRVYSLPPPSGGAVVQYILNIIKGYNMTSNDVADDDSKVLTYHRLIEAMKFAFAKRSELGDENFVDVKEVVKNMTSPSFGEEIREKIWDNQTHNASYYGAKFVKNSGGTSQLSVIDREGNAVSITSTINLYFGSKTVGKRTGIVFNDEMDDFSAPGFPNSFGVPPSKANFIAPGKRPLSSMSPSIVIDEDGNVKMILGASGGTRIITGTLMVMIRALLFGDSLGKAIDSPRIHHQLIPEYILADKFLPMSIQNGLKKKGHIIKYKKIMSVVQAILTNGDGIEAASDARKHGQADGY